MNRKIRIFVFNIHRELELLRDVIRIKLERARKLSAGDVVRVGETDLRFDP